MINHRYSHRKFRDAHHAPEGRLSENVLPWPIGDRHCDYCFEIIDESVCFRHHS